MKRILQFFHLEKFEGKSPNFWLTRQSPRRYPQTVKKCTPKSTIHIFENIQKRFLFKDSAEKRMRNIFGTKNTVYGFNIIDNAKIS